MMQISVIAQENHRVAWVSAFKRLADNHVTRLNALRINHEKPVQWQVFYVQVFPTQPPPIVALKVR